MNEYEYDLECDEIDQELEKSGYAESQKDEVKK